MNLLIVILLMGVAGILAFALCIALGTIFNHERAMHDLEQNDRLQREMILEIGEDLCRLAEMVGQHGGTSAACRCRVNRAAQPPSAP